jgi:ribonuclease P protein component
MVDLRDEARPADARGRYRFPRALRVLRHDAFEQALRRGQRATDARLTVWAIDNGLEQPRLGLVVGRKFGGAVQRNRAKRLLRNAFRLVQHDLPAGIDLICAPRAGATLTLASVSGSLSRLAWQLARRLAKSPRRR